MNSPIEQSTPTPFAVGKTLFARLPGAGLCRMGSWGWEPVPEGVLDAHRAVEAKR